MSASASRIYLVICAYNVDVHLGLCPRCHRCWGCARAPELLETGCVHSEFRSGIPRRFHRQLGPVEVDRAGQRMDGTCK
jgi:hypothetical protein